MTRALYRHIRCRNCALTELMEATVLAHADIVLTSDTSNYLISNITDWTQSSHTEWSCIVLGVVTSICILNEGVVIKKNSDFRTSQQCRKTAVLTGHSMQSTSACTPMNGNTVELNTALDNTQMTHGSEWDMVNRGSSYFHVPRTTVSYGQLQESWIISGLQWLNGNKYPLESKNAQSPNYCSWLAVAPPLCVNYNANFYHKIALINKYKLYSIKTYSKTPKNKKINKT